MTLIEERKQNHQLAAYGGPGWKQRERSLAEEMGQVWGRGGQNSEYARLRHVVLHRPGDELGDTSDPNELQMLAEIDMALAQAQHDAIAATYEAAGVKVSRLDPAGTPTPNQMFMADLLFTTPEGVILARPASTVRAGEERQAARRLAELGIPVVRSIHGHGTFEGADAMWIRPDHLIVGRGLRTNDEGARQIAETVAYMGAKTTVVDLPYGSMHLMGMLRIVDEDLAIGYPLRVVHRAVEALKGEGYQVAFTPATEEAASHAGFNFVTIGPREILMAAHNPQSQAFYESLGITCHPVDVSELRKAAGAMGCLTGILERDMV